MKKYNNPVQCINEKSSKTVRHLWIDLGKALSITLVVYRHCPPNEFQLISSLPLFFFMSGLIFSFDKYNSFLNFLKHRSKQLLVPYFSFFAIFYLYWLIIGRSMSSTEEQAMQWYQPLLEYLYGRPESVCLPLWFVSCLFAMQMLFYLFKNIPRNFAVIVLLSLPFLNCIIDLSNSPWMLDGVCEYFPFYGICLFKKEIFSLLENGKKYVICSILLVISILSFWFSANISNEYLKTLSVLIYRLTMLLPFALIMKILTDKFGLHRLIKHLVTNTVIILAFHTYFIRIFDIFVHQILNIGTDTYEGNFLLKIGMTISIMILIYIPIYVINRYLPFMIGKRYLSKNKSK